eukprot:CCRYP_014061-RA/>CCRYP_014061-RA protein AED:0.03 eAED:0.03 QI:110/1/1/1/1/1/2/1608/270
MSNIHGLHSLRNSSSNNPTNRPSNSDDEDENRFVGGIDSRGGGSGLAVVPNREDIFNQAESADSAGSGEIRRTITMYRSGFTVDNGPYRRLADESNAEFLTSLARGLVPRELQEEGEGEVIVGLVDRRGEEYDPEKHGREDDSADGRGGGETFESFSGEGQSLGGAVTSTSSLAGGIIDPTHPNNTLSPPPVDPSLPTTSIAIRLPDGKRLVVKLNSSHSVATLGQHIGSAVQGQYVLTSGYPPRTIENLEESVEKAGLMGAQVGVKKVG